MGKVGKRFRTARGLVDPDLRYTVDEAVKLIKQTGTAKFNETVEIAVRLGVDPKQADQMVRGAVSLPHGVGKAVRVLVFAEGDAARQALEAGADVVGGDELVEKVLNEGYVDFDKAVAMRNMMAKVGKLGRVLGPRGLMPNPKTNTVVGPEGLTAAIQELKAGRVDFKVERAGIVHTAVGKTSMTEQQLADNILTLMQTLMRLKPSTAKGQYLRGIAVSNTMGPGIRIDVNEAIRLSTELR